MALSGNKPKSVDVLGKYELMQELAIGGMAKLYIARARGLADFSKPVALKRILPQYGADANFVNMFLDEARLAARLHHSNIVQVYDIGQLDGEYFFTMEYVHGESLARVMQTITDEGKQLPLEHSIAIAIGVAAGLHYAHEKCDDDGRPIHIVHRDVAPSNVLISYNGGIKLADFGIAKAATRHHATEVGTLKGRVSYMSPEQSIGAEIDARSDIFSLGVMLYEIVTGTRFYGKANQLAILHRLQHFEVEPPSSRAPHIPPELDAIIMKALETEPDGRYQSASEMQYDLETFAHTHGLFLSSVRLSKFMRALFGDRPEPWKEETMVTQIHTTGRAELLDELEESKPHRKPTTARIELAATASGLESTGTDSMVQAAKKSPVRTLALVAIIMAIGAGAFAATQWGVGGELLNTGSEAPPVAPAPPASAAPPAAAPTPAPTGITEPAKPADGAANEAGLHAADAGPAPEEQTEPAKLAEPVTGSEPAAKKASPKRKKRTRFKKRAKKPPVKKPVPEKKNYDDVFELPDD